jgi:hypothetical protein
MGSIVLIKPGILRTIIIRAGHLGLGLVLRLVARDGYLGSMRTVHFAHWAFLNNGSRLLFFSNFDHSWGSYLDDFIEKAHAGLTLAWGCGVGFPPTRFLVYDGASHGRQFKNWALASRAVSRFWYSAYSDLTVDQVERNNRIANGRHQDVCRDALVRPGPRCVTGTGGRAQCSGGWQSTLCLDRPTPEPEHLGHRPYVPLDGMAVQRSLEPAACPSRG